MTPAPDIAALLFDLDGTLIATRRLYLESFADALEPVLGSRPTHDEMMARRPRAEVRFLREVTLDHLKGREPDHLARAEREVLDRFFAAYQQRHASDFEGVYPGVHDMLELGRRRGLPVGLVTGKSRRSWEITRGRLRLGPFDPVVFDDDVPESKPHPAGLERALAALGTPPARVVYLGDSPTDIEAAVGAGVLPVAVLWSKREHEREPFRELALSHGGRVLEHPSDLASLLDGR